ncbi:MAG: M15 family metallopeptidase [Lachnospiraceae bacterium]|nr:M15 family metallopeptidase [Lachnospiraceae bacterium]
MKRTLDERIRLRLIRFGKKNIFCRTLVIPAIALNTLVFHVSAYIGGNGKRISMLVMTGILFVAYSSFSFPIFISGSGSSDDFVIDEESMGLSLAKETELQPDAMELLDDIDVINDEEFLEEAHGLGVADKYDAGEILDSTDTRGDTSDTDGHEDIDLSNVTFSKDDWRLILINKSHSIPDDYEFPFGTIKTMKGNMQCDERIIDDLLDMLKAAKEDGINLLICSPYRDEEYQVMLFERKITKYMNRGMSYMEAYKLASQTVTVPGASEHQIGLALDIVCDTYVELDEGFGDTEAGIWLAENSYKYGFILRYPKDKEYITCIEYEPWHFRYVGIEAATVITKENLTLEEFWEEL